MKNSNIQCPAPRSTDDLQRRLMHNPREVYRNLQNSDQTFCHPPLTIFFRNILIHMWRCDENVLNLHFLHCFIFASVPQIPDLRPEIPRIYTFHEFEHFTFFDSIFIFEISWSEVGMTKERHGATGSTEGSTGSTSERQNHHETIIYLLFNIILPWHLYVYIDYIITDHYTNHVQWYTRVFTSYYFMKTLGSTRVDTGRQGRHGATQTTSFLYLKHLFTAHEWCNDQPWRK